MALILRSVFSGASWMPGEEGFSDQKSDGSAPGFYWRERRGATKAEMQAACQRMDDIRFDRQFRTPYSESYSIMQGNSRVGAVDIHFTTTTVHGTLILERELEEDEVAKLIEQIDEDLVWSADMPREDFLISVYVGKDIGFYSDDFFDEDDDDDDDGFDLELEDEESGNGKH